MTTSPRLHRPYDRPHTFVYLALFYYAVKGYRLNFEPKDFDSLAQTRAKIKGKFLMSVKNHKEVRQIFGGFMIEPVSLCHSVMCTSGSRGDTRASYASAITRIK